ncbi:hypothetical protein [Defluviimonas sp. SAOS-178_SWC]|uniref:hypothetical protein n=1 Tax=Defluviimonas sp. SAOS-178_SWC TaxID=3121287 RepID=UPI003221CB2D
MSTWISKAGLVASVCLALGACVPGAPLLSGGTATRAIAVSGGAVVVTGPQGYCIDRSAVRDRPDAAFVLFGTCAALSGSASAGQPARPALLTAAVLPNAPEAPALAASFPVLAAFFRSAPGRAALSRSGKGEAVEVLDVTSKDDVLFLHVKDSSAATGPAVDADYWRAVLALRGRMVTLSALGLKDRPLSSSEKRRVLEALVAQMRAANAGPGPAG